MSQHNFIGTIVGEDGEDEGDVTVLMGYDKPLDYVFCVVFGAPDEPLYSNLNDDDAGCHQQDVEYYRPILASMGIRVPESMFIEVAEDQRNRVGNAVRLHELPSFALDKEREGKRA